ncbi:MAG: winged helix-turn-helix domain-containing protein, partial [Lachnospiraceae bacterium]|nr:winged helix-turn-helix domain-containing protein [Lachnospiraceae bacterium]
MNYVEDTIANVNENTVIVKLFGDVCIKQGDKILRCEEVHSEMLTKLLSYIVINHKRVVTSSELTDILWGDEEIENPQGALKNLVYRLRNLLKKNLNGMDYILTGRGTGTYYWNGDIPIVVDIEEFEQCNSRSKLDTISEDEKMEVLRRLCDIYDGAVLQIISSQHWVIQMEAFYNSLYLNAIKQLADIYYRKGEFEQMEVICSDAITHESLDEELYVLKIRSLLGQNKRKLAADIYNKAVKHLQNNLGVREPEKLAKIYKELAGRVSDNQASIEQITFENIENEEQNKTF